MSEIPLWAKSHPRSSSSRPPTIAEHCREVRTAAEHVWDTIESDLAKILGVDPMDLRRDMRPMLSVAGLLHDVGKANSAFQAMLHPKSTALMRQPVRHEILSAVFMTDSTLMGKRMSEILGDDNLWALAWAVGGHHLQLRERNHKDKEDPIYRTANTPAIVTLHFRNEQIIQLVDEIERVLSPPSRQMSVPASSQEPLKEMLLSTLEDDPDGLESLVRRLVRESKRAWRRKMRDRPSLCEARSPEGPTNFRRRRCFSSGVQSRIAKALDSTDSGEPTGPG